MPCPKTKSYYTSLCHGVKVTFFGAKTHFVRVSKYQMAQDVCIFFLQEVLMTVDAAMVINIFSGLPGMRNMGLAKQPHRPSNPVLAIRTGGIFQGIGNTFQLIQFSVRVKIMASINSLSHSFGARVALIRPVYHVALVQILNQQSILQPRNKTSTTTLRRNLYLGKMACE